MAALLPGAMSYDKRGVTTNDGPACGDGALSIVLCYCILEIGLFHVKYDCTTLDNVNHESLCKNTSENIVCHIYFLISLANVSIEANDVDQDQTAPVRVFAAHTHLVGQR